MSEREHAADPVNAAFDQGGDERQTIRSISTALGVPWMDIPSFAGHDARYLHYICPTGMVFIPCKDGISHNEAESIRVEHALDGTRVLAEAVFALANAN